MKDSLSPLFAIALNKIGITDVGVVFADPPDAKLGDYATNVAILAGTKAGRNPMDVAREIIAALPPNEVMSKAEVLRPGFINVTVNDGALMEYFQEHEHDRPNLGGGKTAVTDTSHPNIAKPMGIHHLLSTVIGASINDILAYCGYTVVRDNFLGDYGTQFGKLIYAYKTWGHRTEVKQNPIPELLKLYVKFHDEADKDATMEERGREEFHKLEGGDEENRSLWKWMKELSLKEFEKTWNRLGVSFDTMHGESFYEDKMAEIVEMGKAKGVFTLGEKEALVCKFPDEELPTCVIVKSDGASTYHTRDLARKVYLERTYHPAIILIATDSAHELHFRQLFKMLELLGFDHARYVHAAFGRMQFKDRKMSTRKGNLLPLEEVLDEAVERARGLLEEKRSELPQTEREALAEIIGIGAVKYAILSQNRTTNITFDWDKIISLEGNSAPYLQYTYARGRSVLNKAISDQGSAISTKAWDVGRPTLDVPERALLFKLLSFSEVTARACEEFKPNLIANYLYTLAQTFNHFYNTSPILDAKGGKKELRLKLTDSVTTILQLGLSLLGIKVPERM